MVDLNCAVCGKSFARKASEVKGENTFCGRACYLIRLKEDSAKRKKKRTSFKCDNCAEVFYKLDCQMVGKKNFYCSMPCKNAHQGSLFSRNNHPRWNPELSDEQRKINRKYPEYLSWRTAVYERDEYTCVRCNDDSGGNLIAHHILNYSEHEALRTNVSNGATLCEVCHKGFHDEYGYTKNNKVQLDEFIRMYKPIPSQAAGKPAEGVETNEVA